MKIGIIGLGKMGSIIAKKLLAKKYEIIGFDLDQKAVDKLKKFKNFMAAKNLQDLASNSNIIWIMVPAPVVKKVIQGIKDHLEKGTIVIDGGNTFFEDSISNAKTLKKLGINFLDCGTSGGVLAQKHGFALMVGGDKKTFQKVLPIFKIIGAKEGITYTGPSGSGHYAKMIHNGIEYGLLESYAEGINLLKNGKFKNLDIESILHVWQAGIIRSFILELIEKIINKNPELDGIKGDIDETGMARWMIEEAAKGNLKTNAIESALSIRAWSRKTGGDWGTKLISALRKEFGGHKA